MPAIYLAVCCLNRPFDDQRQDRTRLEGEAVLLVLRHIEAGEWQWIGSEVLEFEIRQTPNLERRQRVRTVASGVGTWVLVEQAEIDRALALEALGFPAVDALHLACAERGGADVFLTTDDRLLRLATRHAGQVRVRVANPLGWIEEMTQ